MINRLRIRLTLWFIFLVIAAYILDASAAYWMLNNRLISSTENNLRRICESIAPAVDYVDGKPTLSNWMHVAIERNIPYENTIQLFGADKTMFESYGPAGIKKLVNGRIDGVSDHGRLSVYSHYINLPAGCFVQTQLSFQSIDQITSAFISDQLIRGIPLVLLLAVFGWFYSGRAVAPIVKSLDTLRTFIDDAGHELNTPVALIENSIQTIEAELQEKQLPTDVLRIIQRASSTLKNLAQRLLLLAKMEQPSVSMHFIPVNLAHLVTDVVHDFSQKAQGQGVDLQIYNLPDVTVLADPDSLIEVFSNVIENALHYTGADGHIYVYGFRNDNGVCIAIRDTGCGIPIKSLSRIFDRFYRVDQARSKKDGGTGLGLSIVKAIVEVHNGNVRAESSPNKGSTFFITLPIASDKESKLSQLSAANRV